MTPKINGLGFDNINSCCKPLERPSKELIRQLDILAVERRPEAVTMQVKIVGQAVMGYVIEHGAQLKGLYLSLENGTDGPVLVACDNSTGDLWCEEFDSVRDAVKWLRRENDVSI